MKFDGYARKPSKTILAIKLNFERKRIYTFSMTKWTCMKFRSERISSCRRHPCEKSHARAGAGTAGESEHQLFSSRKNVLLLSAILPTSSPPTLQAIGGAVQRREQNGCRSYPQYCNTRGPLGCYKPTLNTTYGSIFMYSLIKINEETDPSRRVVIGGNNCCFLYIGR